jgi:hypothetical protein
MDQKHNTQLIPIKQAEVDVRMIEVVNWLNEYTGVITLACCQGADPRDAEDCRHSYVNFACCDLDRIKLITAILASFRHEFGKHIVLTVEESSFATYLLPSFTINFKDYGCLDVFSTWIVHHKKIPVAPIKEYYHIDDED